MLFCIPIKKIISLRLHYIIVIFYLYIVGYTNEEIIYHWKGKTPIVFASDLTMSQFDLIDMPTREFNKSYSKGM